MNVLTVRWQWIGRCARLALLWLCVGTAHAQWAAPTAYKSTAAITDPLYGIQLYNIGPNGLRAAHFSARLGWWGPWQNRGNESGVPLGNWDRNLVGIGWLDFTRLQARVNVFNGLVTQANPPQPLLGNVYRMAPLFASYPTYLWNYGSNTPPAPALYPKSVFYQLPGALNVWGTDTPSHHPYVPQSASDISRYGPPATKLMEHFWNGAGWIGANHGNGVYRDDLPILLGPQSSVWLGETGIVATAQDLGTPLAPSVEILSYDQGRGRWGWSTLRAPDGITHLRAPLILTYVRDDELTARIFVVGLAGSGDNRRWKLYSIERDGDGSWRSDAGHRRWTSHGEVPGLSPAPNAPLCDNALPCGFDMTQAVVWNDGVRTRVNLFGHTDNGAHMPEFWYSGQTWQWGGTPHPRPGSSTASMRVAGAVKVSRPAQYGVGNQFRVSVFVEVGGEVWERFYDTTAGSTWTWQRRL